MVVNNSSKKVFHDKLSFAECRGSCSINCILSTFSTIFWWTVDCFIDGIPSVAGVVPMTRAPSQYGITVAAGCSGHTHTHTSHNSQFIPKIEQHHKYSNQLAAWLTSWSNNVQCYNDIKIPTDSACTAHSALRKVKKFAPVEMASCLYVLSHSSL